MSEAGEAACADGTSLVDWFTSTNELHEHIYAPYEVEEVWARPDGVTHLKRRRAVLPTPSSPRAWHHSGQVPWVKERALPARWPVLLNPRRGGRCAVREEWWMRAMQFRTYGGPEVLEWAEAPDPHPGPGQIRIAVRAASVNPIDWKTISGAMAGGKPMEGTGYLGSDAAGVVDEIGDGVTGVSVGDELFGRGRHAQAEHAVLGSWAAKPPSIDWAVAAAAGVAGETAERGLRLLKVNVGDTLFVAGGAGGVGAVAVQMALARGARVIASASQANHDYLRELGATPVLYGQGMAERVRAAADGPVDAVFDVAGKTPVQDLIRLAPEPSQVVSIANYAAGQAGARVSGGGADSHPCRPWRRSPSCWPRTSWCSRCRPSPSTAPPRPTASASPATSAENSSSSPDAPRAESHRPALLAAVGGIQPESWDLAAQHHQLVA
jgi:NADPH:quinone reductase-like Zn-dependent oxidoreductase